MMTPLPRQLDGAGSADKPVGALSAGLSLDQPTGRPDPPQCAVHLALTAPLLGSLMRKIERA